MTTMTTIQYGFHASPFGEVLLAVTERGICRLAFVEPGSRRAAAAELAAASSGARLVEDEAATAPLARRLFEGAPRGRAPLPLDLRGTAFQLKVWKALLRVPRGATTTYGELAAAIGAPRAARAVGAAAGSNPVAFAVPCHRLVRKTGGMGGYRWGVPRKRRILAWEAGAAPGR